LELDSNSFNPTDACIESDHLEKPNDVVAISVETIIDDGKKDTDQMPSPFSEGY